MCEEKFKKPPIGIPPKYIAIEMYTCNRVEDILDAMERYANDNEPIPVEWVIELRELLTLDLKKYNSEDWWSKYISSNCPVTKGAKTIANI